jgi:hypothetical protein
MNPGFQTVLNTDILPGPLWSRPIKLAKPLLYYSAIAKRSIIVPSGYRSDGLSVPWLFRRLFPKFGSGRRASIVHDYLCDVRPDWSTGKMAADIFLEAMVVDDVSKIKRSLMYFAVRYFGPQWG